MNSGEKLEQTKSITQAPGTPISAAQNGSQGSGLSASASTFTPPENGQIASDTARPNGRREPSGGRDGGEGGRGGGRNGGRNAGRGHSEGAAGAGRGAGRQGDGNRQPANMNSNQQHPGSRGRGGGRGAGQQQAQQHGGAPAGGSTPGGASAQGAYPSDAAATAAAAAAPGGSAAGGAGKRGFVNANHLLNLQYESARPRAGGQGRGGGGRGAGGGAPSSSARGRYNQPRPQKYDRNKFLQANFRFLVSDAVDIAPYEADADRMFDWEDVVQITPCGHVFAFPAIMHHLIHHGGEQLRRSAPCPLCFAPLVARELRLVKVRLATPPKVGDTVTLTLLKRPRNSIIPEPVQQQLLQAASPAPLPPAAAASPSPTAAGAAAAGAAAAAAGGPQHRHRHHHHGDTSQRGPELAGLHNQGHGHGHAPCAFELNRFAKFAVTPDPSPLWRQAAEELAAYAGQVLAEGGLEAAIEAPFIYGALDALAARARRFAARRMEVQIERAAIAACGNVHVPGAITPDAHASAAASASSPSPSPTTPGGLHLHPASSGGSAGAGFGGSGGFGAHAGASAAAALLDPEAAGAAAEALVKSLFVAAVGGAGSAREQAAKVSALEEHFPSLHASSASLPAPPSSQRQPQAAGDQPAPGAPPPAPPPPAGSIAAAAAAGRGSAPALRAPAGGGVGGAGGSAEHGFPFHAAFSDDEDEHHHAADAAAAAAGGGGGGGDAGDLGGLASPPAPARAAAPTGVSGAVGLAAAPGSAAGAGAAASAKAGAGGPAGVVLGSSPSESGAAALLNAAGDAGEHYMYQETQGTWHFLHPLNLRCLLAQYGSYEACPAVLRGTVVEMEDMVQCETTRRRCKFLNHLPLTGTFKLCEIQMAGLLSPEALAPFAEELGARDKRRRRRAADEKRQAAAEAAAARAAAHARLGPSAEELRAMPQLGASPALAAAAAAAAGGAAAGGAGAGGAGAGGAGGGDGPSLAASSVAMAHGLNMSPSDIEESLALQASLDDAAAAAAAAAGSASASGGSVSYAKLTKLGFAATGPSLGASGSSPSGGESAFPALGAAAPAPAGAWGARAAAASTKGPAPATLQLPSGPTNRNSVAAMLKDKGLLVPGQQAGGSSPGGASGAPGVSAAAGWAAAAGGSGAGGGAGGGVPSVGEGGKGKGKASKGVLLFSTTQQRKF